MKFKIEQLAIRPKNTEEAFQLLSDMGITEWIGDKVTAFGSCFGEAVENNANLSFNYQIAPAGVEFEVLEYNKKKFNPEADNWTSSTETNWCDKSCGDESIVSHVGMHCTKAELYEWRQFFALRKIPIAQEVFTSNHTNPNNKNKYNYVIFATRDILGFDIKFIVRLNKDVEYV